MLCNSHDLSWCLGEVRAVMCNFGNFLGIEKRFDIKVYNFNLYILKGTFDDKCTRIKLSYRGV